MIHTTHFCIKPLWNEILYGVWDLRPTRAPRAGEIFILVFCSLTYLCITGLGF